MFNVKCGKNVTKENGMTVLEVPVFVNHAPEILEVIIIKLVETTITLKINDYLYGPFKTSDLIDSNSENKNHYGHYYQYNVQSIRTHNGECTLLFDNKTVLTISLYEDDFIELEKILYTNERRSLYAIRDFDPLYQDLAQDHFDRLRETHIFKSKVVAYESGADRRFYHCESIQKYGNKTLVSSMDLNGVTKIISDYGADKLETMDCITIQITDKLGNMKISSSSITLSKADFKHMTDMILSE